MSRRTTVDDPPDLFAANMLAISSELERLRRNPIAFARLLAWVASCPLQEVTPLRQPDEVEHYG